MNYSSSEKFLYMNNYLLAEPLNSEPTDKI